MIRAVLFDLDGTIGNTLPLCITAFRQAIEPLAGKALTDEEIIARFGPSEEGTIRALIPQHYDQGIEAYLRYYERYHEMTPAPFEGIEELLVWLKSQGIRVAMVTGKGAKSCEITLSRFGIAAYFEWVETGSPLGPRKAEGIGRVLRHCGVAPEEAIYVGDALGDITASRQAGIPVVAAAWAETADVGALRASGPDALFTSVDEFREYLEKKIGG